MENETKVLESLKERFPALDVSEAAVAARRIFLRAPDDCFMDMLTFCAGELGFRHLVTITGLDTGDRFEFIYHIAGGDGILLNIKRACERSDQAVIPSVLPIYQGATFYERELEGLLGVRVEGLPEGRQYPLPDNWPKGEFPMRKGWTPPAKNGAEEEART